MSEFKKYPSTDDSAESLRNRPKSPINRNWSWSPKAPNSHYVVECIDFSGFNHSIVNKPYEVVEASENILPDFLPDSDPINERDAFLNDEINNMKIKSANDKEECSLDNIL